MENTNKTNYSTAVIIVLVIALAGVIWYGFFKAPAMAPVDTTLTPVVADPTPSISGDTGNFVSLSVAPGDTITGPMTITGSIKGGYFFEAVAGGRLLDANKNVIKTFQLRAMGEWMTSDAVSFTASINPAGMTAGRGYIRLANDNASGDPVHDKFIDIPVIF